MNLHHWPRSTPRKNLRPALEPLASNNANEEYSREYGEFLESISATAEELEAIVSMPELSIPEIRQRLRDGRDTGAQQNQSRLGCEVSPMLVKIRPPGVRSPKAPSPRQ